MKEEVRKLLQDEPYYEGGSFSKRKTLKTKCLERAIDFVRFELLYPRLEKEQNGDYTKGFLPALITNTLVGAYLGGENHHAEGMIIGGVITLTQMFLGKRVRNGVSYLSEKYKGIKKSG